jgi:hypothetical protein
MGLWQVRQLFSWCKIADRFANLLRQCKRDEERKKSFVKFSVEKFEFLFAPIQPKGAKIGSHAFYDYVMSGTNVIKLFLTSLTE